MGNHKNTLFDSLPNQLTNEEGGEGSPHGGPGEDDDGDDVAHQPEERDRRQEHARRHELEHLELQRGERTDEQMARDDGVTR